MHHCNSRSGWKFHSLKDISSFTTAESCSTCSESNSTSRRFNPSTNEYTSNEQTISISGLVDNFHTDGFLTLSSLLTPQFTAGLHNECMDIFDGALEWLLLRGHVEFSTSYSRKQQQTSSTSTIDQQTTEDTPTTVYEYPLGVGLKNGYRELVMRSPGRYEMALLIDELPQHYQNRCEQQDELADRLDDAATANYEGKWLMNTKLLDRIKADHCIDTSANGIDDSNKSSGSYCNEKEEKSYLKQLLEWIQHPSSDASSTSESDGSSIEQCEQQYPLDEANVALFMKLVSAIYPPTYSSTSTSDSMADNEANTQPTGSNIQPHQSNDYYICNLSLLVATPGCPTQSWHADGGHTSLTKHEQCHVFNVFIPLEMYHYPWDQLNYDRVHIIIQESWHQ